MLTFVKIVLHESCNAQRAWAWRQKVTCGETAVLIMSPFGLGCDRQHTGRSPINRENIDVLVATNLDRLQADLPVESPNNISIYPASAETNPLATNSSD